MAYNELNYKRRRLFFNKQLTLEEMKQTYDEVYRKYKESFRLKGRQTILGSDTLQAVLNLSDDNWKAFFRLLKAKKDGRLPSWLKVNPPGYSKRGKRRVPFIRLKSRQWEIRGDTIIIKGVPALGAESRAENQGKSPLEGRERRADAEV